MMDFQRYKRITTMFGTRGEKRDEKVQEAIDTLGGGLDSSYVLSSARNLGILGSIVMLALILILTFIPPHIDLNGDGFYDLDKNGDGIGDHIQRIETDYEYTINNTTGTQEITGINGYYADVYIYPPGILIYIILPVILSGAYITYLWYSMPLKMARRRVSGWVRTLPFVLGYIQAHIYAGVSGERALHNASEVLRFPWIRWTLWHSRAMGQNIREAMEEIKALFSGINSGFSSAIGYLTLALEDSSERRKDYMDRAMTISMETISHDMESFMSSLSMPMMASFTFGVILPIVTIVMIPLFPSGMKNTLMVLLLISPIILLLIFKRIIERSPDLFRTVEDLNLDLKKVVISMTIATVVILFFFIMTDGSEPYIFIFPGVFSTIVFALSGWKTSPQNRVRMWVDLLYRTGSHIEDGLPLEIAISRAIENLKDPEDRKILRTGIMTGNLNMSVDGRIPQLILDIIISIGNTGSITGGRILRNLALFMDELLRLNERFQTKMKHLVSTMETTATIFSPVILGIVLILYRMLGGIPITLGGYTTPTGGAMDIGIFYTVLTAYLILLVSIVSYVVYNLRHVTAKFPSFIAKNIFLATWIFVVVFIFGNMYI